MQKMSFSFLLVFVFAIHMVFSQEQQNITDHEHDGSGFELGLSTGYIHLQDDNENGLGLHAHVMKRLRSYGIWRYFAAGLGAETIIFTEAHYAFMAPLAINPLHGLVFSVAPGIQFAEHENIMETDFSIHFEVAWGFEIGNYDIGPVIDYSRTRNEGHYMIGVHFGIHL